MLCFFFFFFFIFFFFFFFFEFEFEFAGCGFPMAIACCLAVDTEVAQVTSVGSNIESRSGHTRLR